MNDDRIRSCNQRSSLCTSVTPLLDLQASMASGIAQIIEYKVSSNFTVLSWAPHLYTYLTLLELSKPSRSLRSAADNRTFRVPMIKKKSRGLRAFGTLALEPGTNSRSLSLRHSPLITQFKVNLKTALCRSAYHSST